MTTGSRYSELLAGTIVRWQLPEEFVDEQLPCPYRLWEHAHRFYEGGEATITEDVVRCRLPFAPFGEIFHPLVRLELRQIFRYRQSAVRSCLLGGLQAAL